MSHRRLLLGMLLAGPMAAQQSVTIIHAGAALDGRGGVIDNPYIIVRGTTIERVATSPVSMPGATTIDLGSATLLPGLIDAHVHPGWYVDRNGKRNSNRSGDTPQQAFDARAGNLKDRKSHTSELQS